MGGARETAGPIISDYATFKQYLDDNPGFINYLIKENPSVSVTDADNVTHNVKLASLFESGNYPNFDGAKKIILDTLGIRVKNFENVTMLTNRLVTEYSKDKKAPKGYIREGEQASAPRSGTTPEQPRQLSLRDLVLPRAVPPIGVPPKLTTSAPATDKQRNLDSLRNMAARDPMLLPRLQSYTGEDTIEGIVEKNDTAALNKLMEQYQVDTAVIPAPAATPAATPAAAANPAKPARPQTRGEQIVDATHNNLGGAEIIKPAGGDPGEIIKPVGGDPPKGANMTLAQLQAQYPAGVKAAGAAVTNGTPFQVFDKNATAGYNVTKPDKTKDNYVLTPMTTEELAKAKGGGGSAPPGGGNNPGTTPAPAPRVLAKGEMGWKAIQTRYKNSVAQYKEPPPSFTVTNAQDKKKVWVFTKLNEEIAAGDPIYKWEKQQIAPAPGDIPGQQPVTPGQSPRYNIPEDWAKKYEKSNNIAKPLDAQLEQGFDMLDKGTFTDKDMQLIRDAYIKNMYYIDPYKVQNYTDGQRVALANKIANSINFTGMFGAEKAKTAAVQKMLKGILDNMATTQKGLFGEANMPGTTPSKGMYQPFKMNPGDNPYLNSPTGSPTAQGKDWRVYGQYKFRRIAGANNEMQFADSKGKLIMPEDVDPTAKAAMEKEWPLDTDDVKAAEEVRQRELARAQGKSGEE
jgi:hypothetical protein